MGTAHFRIIFYWPLLPAKLLLRSCLLFFGCRRNVYFFLMLWTGFSIASGKDLSASGPLIAFSHISYISPFLPYNSKEAIKFVAFPCLRSVNSVFANLEGRDHRVHRSKTEIHRADPAFQTVSICIVPTVNSHSPPAFRRAIF